MKWPKYRSFSFSISPSNEHPGLISIRMDWLDLFVVQGAFNIIFLGSKITADGDCSHEIKGHLLFERKVMTSLDSMFKSRDIILPTVSI